MKEVIWGYCADINMGEEASNHSGSCPWGTELELGSPIRYVTMSMGGFEGMMLLEDIVVWVRYPIYVNVWGCLPKMWFLMKIEIPGNAVNLWILKHTCHPTRDCLPLHPAARSS